MPSDPTTKTAFFSYSREDQEFALKLAQDLRAGGAEIWMDQIDIEPGMAWDRAVQNALETSPRVLVVLSPRSAASDNVSDEVSFALDTHKHVIPVLFRDCDIPLRLRRLQYVDFRVDYAQGLGRLLKALALETPLPASGTPAAFAAEDSGSGHAVVAQPQASSSPAAHEPAGLGTRAGESAAQRPWPAGMKVAAGVAAILLVAIIIWAVSRPKHEVRNAPGSEGRTGSSSDEQYSNVLPSSLGSKWAPTYHRAMAGDAAAMADLGWVYYNGDGATRDYAEAEKWFKKAAAQGNPNGMAGLGSIYLEVRGTPADDKKALELYQRAADGGNAYAMYSIGYMYEYGRGVPQDRNTAIEWYRKAAQAGSVYAKDSLKRLSAKQ